MNGMEREKIREGEEQGRRGEKVKDMKENKRKRKRKREGKERRKERGRKKNKGKEKERRKHKQKENKRKRSCGFKNSTTHKHTFSLFTSSHNPLPVSSLPVQSGFSSLHSHICR